jgi:hypothetical protein
MNYNLTEKKIDKIKNTEYYSKNMNYNLIEKKIDKIKKYRILF